MTALGKGRLSRGAFISPSSSAGHLEFLSPAMASELDRPMAVSPWEIDYLTTLSLGVLWKCDDHTAVL